MCRNFESQILIFLIESLLPHAEETSSTLSRLYVLLEAQENTLELDNKITGSATHSRNDF